MGEENIALPFLLIRFVILSPFCARIMTNSASVDVVQIGKQL
jgi:hypothetical protein